MPCPACGGGSRVYWCRPRGGGFTRLRRCDVCGQRFRTTERTEAVKRGEKFEPATATAEDVEWALALVSGEVMRGRRGRLGRDQLASALAAWNDEPEHGR